MRVLHVIPSLTSYSGGPSNAVINFVRELRERGVDAEIATTNDDFNRLLDVPLNQLHDYQGVPVWFFKRFPLRLRKFVPSIDFMRWARKNISTYDLIHTHSLFSFVPSYAAKVAREKNVPYIMRTLGHLASWGLKQGAFKKNMYSRLIERKNINRANAIHCTSQGEIEDLRNFGCMNDAFSLPLGVCAPKEDGDARNKILENYEVEKDTLIILYISRLDPKKRPELLLRSLKNILKFKKAHLILAGDGFSKYVDSLKKLIQDLDLTDFVSTPGWIDGDEKSILFQGSDVFVLPSYAENFGIAVAEAMSSGLPVIVTKEVQISRDIINSNAGIVVDGDVESITEAVRKINSDELFRASLIQNARRLVSEEYDWTVIAGKLVQIYEKILRGKKL